MARRLVLLGRGVAVDRPLLRTGIPVHIQRRHGPVPGGPLARPPVLGGRRGRGGAVRGQRADAVEAERVVVLVVGRALLVVGHGAQPGGEQRGMERAAERIRHRTEGGGVNERRDLSLIERRVRIAVGRAQGLLRVEGLGAVGRGALARGAVGRRHERSQPVPVAADQRHRARQRGAGEGRDGGAPPLERPGLRLGGLGVPGGTQRRRARGGRDLSDHVARGVGGRHVRPLGGPQTGVPRFRPLGVRPYAF